MQCKSNDGTKRLNLSGKGIPRKVISPRQCNCAASRALRGWEISTFGEFWNWMWPWGSLSDLEVSCEGSRDPQGSPPAWPAPSRSDRPAEWEQGWTAPRRLTACRGGKRSHGEEESNLSAATLPLLHRNSSLGVPPQLTKAFFFPLWKCSYYQFYITVSECHHAHTAREFIMGFTPEK